MRKKDNIIPKKRKEKDSVKHNKKVKTKNMYIDIFDIKYDFFKKKISLTNNIL